LSSRSSASDKLALVHTILSLSLFFSPPLSLSFSLSLRRDVREDVGSGWKNDGILLRNVNERCAFSQSLVEDVSKY
jgi:hypothetical protein